MFLPFLFFVVLVNGESFLGGGDSGTAVSAKAVIASGATHVRVYLLWRYVQGTVHGPLENITVAGLRKNASMVYSWAAMQDWSELDRRMSFYANSSIQVIGEVTEGTSSGLPNYNGTFFDPNVVGQDVYLAYVYRAARATVNRYKNRISLWQIENELNEAWIARLKMLFGPAFLFSFFPQLFWFQLGWAAPIPVCWERMEKLGLSDHAFDCVSASCQG